MQSILRTGAVTRIGIGFSVFSESFYHFLFGFCFVAVSFKKSFRDRNCHNGIVGEKAIVADYRKIGGFDVVEFIYASGNIADYCTNHF